jgi:hypothetical protein
MPSHDVDPATGIGHREEIPDVAPDGTGGARPEPDMPPTR